MFFNKYKKTNNLEYASMSESYTPPSVIPNFITPKEKEYILNYANSKFKDSEILNGKDESIRKSQTCWISKENDVVKKIMMKACKLTNLPFENCEDLQVLKYDKDGFYNDHHDSCCDNNEHCESFVKRGGQRKVTIVIYLNNNFEGGSTHFPKLDKYYKAPELGALLFYPLSNDSNKCHPLALHTGTKVTKGNKYICNIWIRENKFI